MDTWVAFPIGCCDDDARNTGVQISASVPAFPSLARHGIATSYGSSVFDCWGIVMLFALDAVPFYIPSKGSELSAFLSTF